MFYHVMRNSDGTTVYPFERLAPATVTFGGIGLRQTTEATLKLQHNLLEMSLQGDETMEFATVQVRTAFDLSNFVTHVLYVCTGNRLSSYDYDF